MAKKVIIGLFYMVPALAFSRCIELTTILCFSFFLSSLLLCYSSLSCENFFRCKIYIKIFLNNSGHVLKPWYALYSNDVNWRRLDNWLKSLQLFTLFLFFSVACLHFASFLFSVFSLIYSIAYCFWRSITEHLPSFV